MNSSRLQDGRPLAADRTVLSDFKIGEWWVRSQRNELERARNIVAIEGKSMGVLVSLAHHAPHVVGKERLIAEVWSDTPYVGDDVITHAIWELRKALGDSARAPQYIRTVPRKGYCLVAEVLRPQGSPLPLEGVRIDHYDLGNEIGRGAMGVVFEAVDRRLRRTVAIKFLAEGLTRDVKACQRFEREARLAASLDHPNLATVHEIGETSEGHRYLVIAHYPGGSLKDRLANGALPLQEALALGKQLLAGLGAAHERGIIHRDIKPANLMLDSHGTLKICDFGIAKLLGATDLTGTGTTLGTPAYKSPEQSQGLGVDHRTDLWSAAIVLFELITGQRPFDPHDEPIKGHSTLLPLYQAWRTDPVNAGSLGSFFDRGLAKEVEQRFHSVAEMATALDRLDNSSLPLAFASKKWRRLAIGTVVIVLFTGLRLALPPIGGKENSAIQDTEQATAEVREPGTLHLALGQSQWLRGNHNANLDKTQEHFERAVEHMPDSADAKTHLAAFLASQNFSRSPIDALDTQIEKISRLVREALELNPQSGLAQATLARLAYLGSDSELAEKLADEAIRRQPTCTSGKTCDLAYLWRGEALWDLGRIEEAKAVLIEGTRQGGGPIRCNLKLAQLSKSVGEYLEAEQAYRQVLDYDQVQSTALTDLAILLFKHERFDEALTYLQSAYAQTWDPSIAYNLGLVQYYKQVWGEAKKSFRNAHKGYQSAGLLVPSPLVALGDVELEVGNPVEAKEFYKRALLIFNAFEDPSVTRKLQRAVCLAKLGRFDEALAEVEPRLRDPKTLMDFPDITYYAGRIYALKGDRKTLFELAHRWRSMGHTAANFRDDAAFIAYRDDIEYRRVLEPELFPDL